MNVWRGAAEDRLQLIDVDSVDEAAEPADPSAEPEPFDAFYHREYGGLRVLAHALVGSASAEDLVQETMLVAYRKWDQVQLMESPTGWLRGVCAHKGKSALRRRTAEQKALGRLQRVPRPDRTTQPDHEAFWSLVRRLPARQAQVVCLHYALGLGVAEIGRTLGCAEGTVKAHLSRARTALARALGEEDDS